MRRHAHLDVFVNHWEAACYASPRGWIVVGGARDNQQSNRSTLCRIIWRCLQNVFDQPATERLSVVCLTKSLASLQAIQHIFPYYEISSFLLPIEYPKCGFEDDTQVAREARTL